MFSLIGQSCVYLSVVFFFTFLLLNYDLQVFIGSVVVDDTFYYLKTAQMFVDTGLMSFDGINLTNGFHPLWMIVAVLIASLPLDPISKITILSGTSAVFFLAGAALIALFLRPKMPVILGLFIFSSMVFSFQQLRTFFQGMENGISFFLVSVLLCFCTRLLKCKEVRPEKAIIFGTILALIALARVDQILLVLAFLAAFFLRHGISPLLNLANFRLEIRNSSIFFVTAPLFVIFGGYLGLNYIYFGDFFPVSGRVKAFYESEWFNHNGGFPHGGFFGNIWFHINLVLDLSILSNVRALDGFLFNQMGLVLPRLLPLSVVNVLVLLPLISAVIHGLDHMRNRSFSLPLVTLYIFSILHLLLYAVKLPHFTSYGTWYFSTEFMAISLAYGYGLYKIYHFITSVAYHFSQKLSLSLGAMIIGVFFLFPFLVTTTQALRFNSRDLNTNMFLQASQWINSELPKGKVIGAHSAGVLGYFIEGSTVVNLDGLINSHDYFQKVLRLGGFPAYFLDKLDYYADYSPNNLEDVGVCWTGGCVKPSNLQLVNKWQVTDDTYYYIFKVVK